jgi:peroxiredoxin
LASAPLAGALAFARAATAQPLAHLNVGAPAPAFSAPGADGRTHSLGDYRGKVVVLEWTNPACPFTAEKYRTGAIQRLQRSAAKQGFVWLSVVTGAKGKPSYLTPAQARARVAKLHAKVTTFLFDRDGRVGRAYGAKTTPSFFIVDQKGRLAYQGAIDADGDASGKDTRSYVQAALDDLAAGRAVRTPATRPYGCEVTY